MKYLEQFDGVTDDAMSRLSDLARLDEEAGKDTAAVVENVLVSIAGGMSSRNKEIVCDAIQYAMTRAGNSRKNVEWYETFMNSMKTCGFPSTRARYGEYQATDTRLTMDKLGLEILTRLIGSAVSGPLSAKLLLGLVGSAFESLKSQDKPLELFQRGVKRFNDVSFAIVSGVETADGDVLLAMAIVTIKVQLSVTNVLFWDFNTSSVTIERGENATILNHRQWRRVEKLVDEYLTNEAIAEFASIK
ncbi:hypothetical protein ACTUVN_002004 [Pseudomonas caspiana]